MQIETHRAAAGRLYFYYMYVLHNTRVDAQISYSKLQWPNDTMAQQRDEDSKKRETKVEGRSNILKFILTFFLTRPDLERSPSPRFGCHCRIVDCKS